MTSSLYVGFSYGKMGFSYGRSEGFPSQYGENKTPVTVDVLDWIFIISFLIVFISTSVVYFRFKRIEVSMVLDNKGVFS